MKVILGNLLACLPVSLGLTPEITLRLQLVGVYRNWSKPVGPSDAVAMENYALKNDGMSECYSFSLLDYQRIYCVYGIKRKPTTGYIPRSAIKKHFGFLVTPAG